MRLVIEKMRDQQPGRLAARRSRQSAVPGKILRQPCGIDRVRPGQDVFVHGQARRFQLLPIRVEFGAERRFRIVFFQRSPFGEAADPRVIAPQQIIERGMDGFEECAAVLLALASLNCSLAAYSLPFIQQL